MELLLYKSAREVACSSHALLCDALGDVNKELVQIPEAIKENATEISGIFKGYIIFTISQLSSSFIPMVTFTSTECIVVVYLALFYLDKLNF